VRHITLYVSFTNELAFRVTDDNQRRKSKGSKKTDEAALDVQSFHWRLLETKLIVAIEIGFGSRAKDVRQEW